MKIKLGVSLILAFLVFVFITQNTETVQVKFLFWSREMSLVLMVFLMFVAGIMVGWLVSSYLRYARHRKPLPSSGRAVAEQPTSRRPVDGREVAKEDLKETGGDPAP